MLSIRLFERKGPRDGSGRGGERDRKGGGRRKKGVRWRIRGGMHKGGRDGVEGQKEREGRKEGGRGGRRKGGREGGIGKAKKGGEERGRNQARYNSTHNTSRGNTSLGVHALPHQTKETQLGHTFN